MNVVTVNINGMDYNLKGVEDEEYLHRVARYVDKKLKTIMDSNPKLSLASASVLTALNAADDMFKCDEAYEKLEEKADKLLTNEEIHKNEIEALKKQIKFLENYNEELLQKMKNSNAASIQQKEEELNKLNKAFTILEDSAKQYKSEGVRLKAENKELKFQIQSYKYKTMDLENKLIENGIRLAKAKAKSNPLLSPDL
jgi:cell division protein ZapA